MNNNITRLFSEINLVNLYKSKGYYDLTKDQIHYLIDVKRSKKGDLINLIDGKSGEYQSEVVQISKKTVKLKINYLLKTTQTPSDLFVLFSPIKKTRTEFIIEKCVELGVKTLIPVICDYTNINSFNQNRIKKIMVNSAQQCGSTWMPNLLSFNKLENVLKDWNPKRNLFFCDEKLTGDPILKVLNKFNYSKAAILVGPEGGFSKKEISIINNLSFVKKVSLGKQILRAETAVISAVSIWQSYLGDWKNK